MLSTKIYIYMLIVLVTTSFNVLFAQESAVPTTKQELRKNFMAALETQNEEAIIRALESGDVEVKSVCFQVLAKKGASDQKMINLLNTYITYGYYLEGLPTSTIMASWTVRNEAIKAASTLKSETSVEQLIYVLKQEQNPTVIISAINALGNIGSLKATSPLLTYLIIAKNPTIVNEIVIAFGKIGSTDALPALIDVIQNDKYSMTIKNNAVESIKQLKQTAANNDSTTAAN